MNFSQQNAMNRSQIPQGMPRQNLNQQQPQRQTFIPKKPLRLSLNPNEQTAYSQLVAQADPNRIGKIGGRDGVTFFKKSGLPVDRLKEIWQISARTSIDYLTHDEFFVALRLIAYAQNNIVVSEDSILMNFKVDLPRFEGQSPNQRSNAKSVGRPLVAHHANGQVQPSVPGQSSIWQVNQQDVERYRQQFIFFDTEKKGFLTEQQLGDVFAKTMLPVDVVQKVLSLVAPLRAGSQVFGDIYAASMHMLTKFKKEGVHLPNTLPRELYDSIKVLRPQNLPQPQFGPPTSMNEVKKGVQFAASPVKNDLMSFDIKPPSQQQNISPSQIKPSLKQVQISNEKPQVQQAPQVDYKQVIAAKQSELDFLKEMFQQDQNMLREIKNDNINLNAVLKKLEEDLDTIQMDSGVQNGLLKTETQSLQKAPAQAAAAIGYDQQYDNQYAHQQDYADYNYQGENSQQQYMGSGANQHYGGEQISHQNQQQWENFNNDGGNQYQQHEGQNEGGFDFS